MVLKKEASEGTADEESPLSSSGLVDAYKEDEESALDLDYPQPKVCFLTARSSKRSKE